jgi:hypothetical protein
MAIGMVLATVLAAPGFVGPLVQPPFRLQDEPAEAPFEEPAPPGADEPVRRRPTVPGARDDERIRLRFGVFTAVGTLNGRLEKEDAQAGPGSGGDKVSLRSDLDMPLFSWAWRTEALLEPAPHLRLRFAADLMRVVGGNTLGEGFRHDGRLFLAGTRVESELQGALLDAEFHFLPRQALRRAAEFGLFAGVRFAYFTNEIEQPSVQRVTGRTTGLWPRFGVQGYGPLGGGMTIWGHSAVGGWLSGDANNYYGAASFDFAVGLGWVRERLVDVRVGYHYQTFGIWRERGNDMERLTAERHFFVVGVLFWTP